MRRKISKGHYQTRQCCDRATISLRVVYYLSDAAGAVLALAVHPILSTVVDTSKGARVFYKGVLSQNDYIVTAKT
jgi:hypothetical protein